MANTAKHVVDAYLDEHQDPEQLQERIIEALADFEHDPQTRAPIEEGLPM